MHADEFAAIDGRDVRGDGAKAGLGVLDEISVDRAARHRFDAERAGTGEQVQHAGVGERGSDDAHPRFAHPIGRGPHGASVRRHQPSPLPSSCHDAHAMP